MLTHLNRLRHTQKCKDAKNAGLMKIHKGNTFLQQILLNEISVTTSSSRKVDWLKGQCRYIFFSLAAVLPFHLDCFGGVLEDISLCNI